MKKLHSTSLIALFVCAASLAGCKPGPHTYDVSGGEKLPNGVQVVMGDKSVTSRHLKVTVETMDGKDRLIYNGAKTPDAILKDLQECRYSYLEAVGVGLRAYNAFIMPHEFQGGYISANTDPLDSVTRDDGMFMVDGFSHIIRPNDETIFSVSQILPLHMKRCPDIYREQ